MSANQLAIFTGADPEKLHQLLTDVETAFWDIPFENSAYQTRTFAIAAELTPGRAYRAIGLRMTTKIQALKEAMYHRDLAQVDIEELEVTLADSATNGFERRRAQINLTRKRDQLRGTEKLINDAVTELDVLYAEFQKYPRYTRALFEAEEATHFEAKLTQQLRAGGEGAVTALLNMSENAAQLTQLLRDVHLQLGQEPPAGLLAVTP